MREADFHMQPEASTGPDCSSKPMGRIFVELALQGKNEWWRYLLALLLILLASTMLGSIPMAALVLKARFDGDPHTYFDRTTAGVVGIDPLLNYVAVNFSLLMLLIGVCLVVRLIHNRPVRTLVTSHPRFSWKRLGQGFGLFLVLASADAALGYILAPSKYEVTLDLRSFFLFVPFALVLTPLQAAGEELFFRGYLLQGLGLLLRKPPLLLVVSGVLFLLLHLPNPEMASGSAAMAAVYFALGLFLALLTLRDNRLELAIGVHTANNLFMALFVNYRGSVLTTPSIFTLSRLDPAGSLLSLIVMAVIFYLLIFGLAKRITLDTSEAGV